MTQTSGQSVFIFIVQGYTIIVGLVRSLKVNNSTVTRSGAVLRFDKSNSEACEINNQNQSSAGWETSYSFLTKKFYFHDFPNLVNLIETAAMVRYFCLFVTKYLDNSCNLKWHYSKGRIGYLTLICSTIIYKKLAKTLSISSKHSLLVPCW